MEKKSSEQFIKEAKEKLGNNFDFSKTIYVNNNTKVCIKCLRHNIEYFTLPRALKECPLCIKEKRRKSSTKTNEQFIKEAKEKWKDRFDYSNTKYINYTTKVEIKCNVCGNTFLTFPRTHLTKNGGCSYCSHKKVNNLKRIDEKEIIERCKKREKYDCSLIKYKGSHSKIEIVCPIHGSFWMLPNNFFTAKQDCPKCILTSKREKEVRDYLTSNNIQFEEQKKFDDLKDKKRLSYDFYLPELKILIECQGQQHYKQIDFFGGRKAFLLQKHHDWLKRKYAVEHGYKLITIPYWSTELKLIL
jgi:very-short-patch-repair endonuclease